jgi:diguanylate cyclase (GGDEF)-like protein/PAS domain S-box-containing protein
MKSLAEAVEAVVRALGLDEAAIARRKAFLEFTDEDAARLRRLHAALQELGPGFARAFYDHLLRFEETRRLIPDSPTLERLRQAQATYFDSLTAGDYGPDYLLNRLRVGVVHQRVGLEPGWYLSAYAKYLAGLLPEVWRRLGEEPRTFIATVQSLIKIALLDMSLAMETYIHGDRQTVLALKQYAELVFSAIPDGLVVLSSDATILSANRAFLKRFGLAEDAVCGRPLSEIIAADGIEERIREVQAGGVAQHDLPLRMGARGARVRIPVRVTLTGIRLAEEEEEEEEEARLLMIVEDVTEQTRLEDALRASEADLLRAQAVAHIGSWHLDFATGALQGTPEVFRIFGLPRTTPLSYETFLSCVHPDDRKIVAGAWQAAMSGGVQYQVEHRIVSAGVVRWVEERAEIEFDDEGRPLKAVGSVQDITERKTSEARIEQLAFYDPLTGLPNRALFLDRLKQALGAARRHRSRVALLFVDLDRFKEINDTAGHDVGDFVLAAVARRLKNILRQEETLARLSGDEFVAIAPGADQAAAVHIAERIQTVLSEPLALTGRIFSLGASIGIAFYPEDGATPEDLLKHTDIAMYRAKAAGGGYRFYHARMSAELERRLEVARRLEAALNGERLQLYYQPQVHLATGRLVGAEALARWHDSEWGWVNPAEFIPIAEERGLIGTLGEWALATACRQARRWAEARGGPLGRVAVNVAARQLEDDGFVDRVLAIVRNSGVTPAAIELELTESSMMADPERAIEVTQALAAAGFALAIDDFGTGYSSLSYLKRFAADKLKIDMSFVRDMLTDRNDYAIVSTIVAMGGSLGLETLAEGVETVAQAQALQALGCHLAQGYHFGRPEPAEDFARRWLHVRNG